MEVEQRNFVLYTSL